jgi:hypothetical protein
VFPLPVLRSLPSNDLPNFSMESQRFTLFPFFLFSPSPSPSVLTPVKAHTLVVMPNRATPSGYIIEDSALLKTYAASLDVSPPDVCKMRRAKKSQESKGRE